MVSLNDYLYAGNTELKILHQYAADLRESAKRESNSVDLAHCNFLIQIREILEHNDFLTTQSNRIKELYKYMTAAACSGADRFCRLSICQGIRTI